MISGRVVAPVIRQKTAIIVGKRGPQGTDIPVGKKVIGSYQA
jgi:hypothetical protein